MSKITKNIHVYMSVLPISCSHMHAFLLMLLPSFIHMHSYITDIDECADLVNPCSPGLCENTNGSYICQCPEGYKFTAGGCSGR